MGHDFHINPLNSQRVGLLWENSWHRVGLSVIIQAHPCQHSLRNWLTTCSQNCRMIGCWWAHPTDVVQIHGSFTKFFGILFIFWNLKQSKLFFWMGINISNPSYSTAWWCFWWFPSGNFCCFPPMGWLIGVDRGFQELPISIRGQRKIAATLW